MGGNRQAVSVVLDEALRVRLTSLAGSTRGQVRAVLRAKIVLAAAAAASNAAIARTLGVSVNTVRKWRGRFTAAGMEGLNRDHADVNAAKNTKAAGHAVSACGDLGTSRSVKQEPVSRATGRTPS
ncbi:helix-turn-helix domain-containing protein [Streptomyces sp. NPDC001312]|uniref:helix-turn-helix domain-containing protein n=1 Tax=Streptomyces sp. NPDC001312 TaxID=3364561 RepID=UPI0036BCECF7